MTIEWGDQLIRSETETTRMLLEVLYCPNNAETHEIFYMGLVHILEILDPFLSMTEQGFGQWASYQIRKIAGAHAPGMPGKFSPPPRVSDPGMHHGTCVTHVPWCMLGSLSNDFLWSRRRGKTFPAFPAHAQTAILRIWQEAHGSLLGQGSRFRICVAVLCIIYTHVSFNLDVIAETDDVFHLANRSVLWWIMLQRHYDAFEK